MYAPRPDRDPHPGRGPAGQLPARPPPSGTPTTSIRLFQVLACRSGDDGRTWERGGPGDRRPHGRGHGPRPARPARRQPVPPRLLQRAGPRGWARGSTAGDGSRGRASPSGCAPATTAAPGRRPAASRLCPTPSGATRPSTPASAAAGCWPWPDGRLLLPSKATDRPGGAFPCFGMLRVSRDMGETWEYGGRIAEDDVAHFSEPAIHRTPSGRILVLFPLPPGGPGSRHPPRPGLRGTDRAGPPVSLNRLLAPRRVRRRRRHLDALGARPGSTAARPTCSACGTAASSSPSAPAGRANGACAGRVLDPEGHGPGDGRRSSSIEAGRAQPRLRLSLGPSSGRTAPSSSSTGTTTPTATAASRPRSSRRAD